MADDKFLILNINGGAGKNVLATAVVKAIKNNKPDVKIIILTAYTDIWMHNPNVYKCFLHGHAPYFYSDYIKGRNDVQICTMEPYTTQEYLLNQKHLIEIWCDLVGVPYSNEKPELFFNQRELQYAQNKFYDGRKIFLIQTNGGMQQDVKISWMRDMPLGTAQEIVNKFSNEYRIIHVRREDQPALNGAEASSVQNFRELMCLVRLSEKRLFIDSICQHIAAAIKKPSTVLWVRNSPEVLGYSMHDNIITKVEDEIDVLRNSILEPYDIAGNIYQCPFNEDTILFDSNEVIDSLTNQKLSTIDIAPIMTNGNHIKKNNTNNLETIKQ